MPILPVSLLSQVRRDVREIEGEAESSSSHCYSVKDISQGIGRRRSGRATSEATKRDSVSKLEVTLVKRELGLCPD
jgi:hypothetical protein